MSDRDEFEQWLTENVDPDDPGETSFWDVWRAAVKQEREACAKICENFAIKPHHSVSPSAAEACAYAVRRGRIE